jgi:hypothetical protein
MQLKSSRKSAAWGRLIAFAGDLLGVDWISSQLLTNCFGSADPSACDTQGRMERKR